MTVTLFFFPIISAIRIISRDSSPPGSVDVTPGAAEASMTLKLKLTYCASVSFHTRSIAPWAVSILSSRTP